MIVPSQSVVHPIEILLVEDNPGDIRLAQEVLEEGSIRSHLNVVDDGEKRSPF
jgi:CheY-like chemotaxis protein